MENHHNQLTRKTTEPLSEDTENIQPMSSNRGESEVQGVANNKENERKRKGSKDVDPTSSKRMRPHQAASTTEIEALSRGQLRLSLSTGPNDGGKPIAVGSNGCSTVQVACGNTGGGHYSDLFKPYDLLVHDPLKNHPQLDNYSRSTVSVWLVHVCSTFGLSMESYHLALNYFDRYLSKKHNIKRSRLILIATACLFIAMKLEEHLPTDASEVVTVADGGFTARDLLAQELDVLSTLGWKLRVTPASSCLNFMCQVIDLESTERVLTAQELNAQPEGVQLKTLINQRFQILDDKTKSYLFTTHKLYDTSVFRRASAILTLASFDPQWSRFTGMALATSALQLACMRRFTIPASLEAADLDPCFQWMKPFYAAMRFVPAAAYECKVWAFKVLRTSLNPIPEFRTQIMYVTLDDLHEAYLRASLETNMMMVVTDSLSSRSRSFSSLSNRLRNLSNVNDHLQPPSKHLPGVLTTTTTKKNALTTSGSPKLSSMGSMGVIQ